MSLDVITLIVIIAFFMRGYSRGIIVATFSVAAILLGVLVSLKLSQSFAAWLLAHNYISSGWAQVAAYFILFTGVVLLVRMLAKVMEKAAEGMLLGTVNKLAGGLLYVCMGAILWSSLLWLGARAQLIPAPAIAESRSYPWLAELAPWFFHQAGKLMPFVQDTFVGLEQFFDTINSKAADVGTH
jgi:membrane protein required for colicin V production